MSSTAASPKSSTSTRIRKKNVAAGAASKQQPSIDGKPDKSALEKLRRDRMNKALEELKVIIIRHDPNHTSKLEKADILEKTLELVRFFEFQISQLQLQTTAQTFFNNGLSTNKVLNQPSNQNQHLPNPVPPPPSIQPQSVPSLSYQPAWNPFLFLQSLAAAASMSTPNGNSQPANNVSRTNAESEEKNDDDIDIEKVDEEHDETFSPLPTPKQSRKRSHDSSATAAAATEEDDSGIYDDDVSPPKKQKPTTSSFSIDGILK